LNWLKNGGRKNHGRQRPALALQNQSRLDAAGVFVINVMASSGAGKTSLIPKTIAASKVNRRIAVIEGDTAAATICSIQC
jgi:hydrogenase nickel incorporation protein HypB